jgi:cysteine-rich repeat protein
MYVHVVAVPVLRFLGVRGAARLTALAVTLALAACAESPLVPCGDLSCPPSNVCTPGGCALPADVDACNGLAEGDTCHSALGGTGVCQGGACKTGLCGNGKIDLGEVCDGELGVDVGQSCSEDCTRTYECGNAVVDPGEDCDDGNKNDADGCASCRLSTWIVQVLVGTAVDATTISLANPSAIAADGLGRIYIADTNNNRIRRIEQDGSLTTLAGTGAAGFSGDGGPATSAELNLPSGIAVDGIGQVFVSDTTNHRVRRIDSDGTIVTIAGTGSPGFSGDGGAASLAQLASPHGLVVDGLGRIFIADTDNHAIRRIDVDGKISTVAGTPPTSGAGAENVAAIASALDSPFAVAVDQQGRVLIADSANQRVRRIALDDTIATIAGTGNFGYNGDGIQATAADLAGPAAIAVDAQGRVVIAEAVLPRVRRIASDGTISTIAGDGTNGYAGDGGAATAAQLAQPLGVAVDPIGLVSIADTNNQRVRTIATNGMISTIGGTGTFGFGGDSTEATSALLAGPFDTALDTQGRIYITDTFHNTVRRVELDGTITVIAGTGIAGDTGNNVPGREAQLSGPNGIIIDSLGRVVIADVFNNKIKRIDTNGIITTIAGTGAPGSSGDNQPAIAAKLDHPNDVAIDSTGRILIADTYNSKIRRIELNGTITTVAGTGTSGYDGDGVQATTTRLSFPYSVGVDSQDRILIPDTSNQRIRRVAANGVITTIAGTGTQGYNGAGLQATASQISGPQAAHEDSMGRIVFSDVSNHILRRIELDGTLTTIAGVAGVSEARGDGGPANIATISNPHGLAIGPGDKMIFPDTNNDRVRKIENGIITTVAGRIDPENVGPIAKARLDDPQATAFVTQGLTLVAGGSSGTLETIHGTRVEAVAGNYPQATPTGALARYRTRAFKNVGGVAFDPSTNFIYISETSANRIHVITQAVVTNPLTWTIAPLANDAGTAGFADGDASTALFRSPSGLFLDSAARKLYIADTGNHAIRVLDLTTNTVSTLANASHALGFGGDGGPATGAKLYRPSAITKCPNGDLFIADTGNNRVRRIASGVISTVLGDGVPASSGEGLPARTFPVDGPRGLACDTFGNLFVTSTTTVRLVTASDAGIVDGTGTVKTIYGAPPRDEFPSSITSCLTGIEAIGATTLQVTDACTGLLLRLDLFAAGPI